MEAFQGLKIRSYSKDTAGLMGSVSISVPIALAIAKSKNLYIYICICISIRPLSLGAYLGLYGQYHGPLVWSPDLGSVHAHHMPHTKNYSYHTNKQEKVRAQIRGP